MLSFVSFAKFLFKKHSLKTFANALRECDVYVIRFFGIKLS